MNTPSPMMKNDPERAAAAGLCRRVGPEPDDQDEAWSGALAKLSERAVPPMTKALSAALSARSDGFDDIDGSPECRVYTQMRCIEQVRVWSRFKRGDAAP